MTFEEKWNKVVNIPKLLEDYGEDLEQEGLEDTPERVQATWKEFLKGYLQDPEDILGTTFETEGAGVQLCKNIEFTSVCFGAGTKILMRDFSWKNIEEVNIGEEVISMENPRHAQKRFATGRVTKLFKRNAKVIKVNNTFVTPSHEYWRQRARNIWTTTRADLLDGKELLKLPAKKKENVRVTKPNLVLPVYNITTEPHHNYVADGFLVENCMHHLVPFFGVVHIGYTPKDALAGLSKLSRIVDCFSQRLQIQERMTHQIADSVQEYLEPESVLVIAKGKHLCCHGRGVKRTGMFYVTLASYGDIEELYPLLLGEERNRF